MSEPTDGLDGDPIVTGRVRASDFLVLLGSLKAEVRQGTEAARRTEEAVGNMAIRVGHLEAEMASVKSTLAAVQDEQRTGRRQPVSVVSVLAVVVAAAAVVVSILLDAYHS